MNRPAIDPAATGEQLSALAAQHPELHTAIALHPNAYDGLLDWIASYGDDAAKAAVDYRRSLAAAPVATAGPAAPVAPPPPRVLPEFAAAAAPADPVMVPAASVSATKPKRRLKAPVIAVVAVALVLALGGGAWAVVRAITGGAATPEAAAEKLVGSVLKGDLIGLATVMAPSEASVLRDSMQKLASVQPAEGEKAAQEALTALAQAVTITSERVEYRTQKLADKISLVRMVSGRFTVDGDPDEITDALMALVAAQFELNKLQYGNYYSDAEWEQMMAEARDSMADSLAGELPYVLDVQDAIDNSRTGESPLAVVVVDEGGWYVSPLLSAAELAASSTGDFRHGRSVVDAQKFDSPQAAADGTARAYEDFSRSLDPLDLAPVLPLPERRLVSLYGTAPLGSSGLSPASLRVERFEIEAQVSGDRAAADITDLTLSLEGSQVWLAGDCVGDDYNKYCLADAIDQAFSEDNGGPGWSARDLGLDEPKLILVRENGGWLISPLATAAELVARVSVALNGLRGK